MAADSGMVSSPHAHPRQVAQFKAELHDFEYSPGFSSREYSLACRTCHAAVFETIQLFKPRTDIRGGIAGLALQCVGCGATVQLFNGSRDGYDGELGHSDDLAGEVSSRAILDEAGIPYPPGLVRAGFTYNIDDLVSTALEVGRRQVDLFDWFDGLLLVNDEWVNVFSYECA